MKTLTALLAILFAGGIIGCNTISGAGQDVSALGDTVEDVAEETKDEMTDDD